LDGVWRVGRKLMPSQDVTMLHVACAKGQSRQR
jgi:hypothetical protein